MKSRYECPNCKHKHEYTRYIDSKTKELLPIRVGKCNRINECSYHYTPKQYFLENNITNSNFENSKTHIEEISVDYIPVDYFLKSYEDHQNNFMKYLNQIFDRVRVSELQYMYAIGSGKLWPGATVFWQLDYNERIRTGKIILFDENGKRVKKPYNHINWVHSALIKKGFLKEFHLQ